MWEAIEVDMAASGLTMDMVPAQFSWRAVLGMLRYPARTGAIWRRSNGAKADWPIEVQFLAGIRHLLAIANWQQTKDGHKGRNIPKPVPTPWDEEEVRTKPGRQKFGKGAVPLTAFRSWWEAK